MADPHGGAGELSEAELAAAHRRLAAIYHPDRYVDAPASVRDEAERRMKEVNAIFHAARRGRRSPARLAKAEAEPQSLVGEELQRAYREAIQYKGSACDFCGWGPAAQIRLKTGVGMLIMRRVRTLEASACQHCGLAMFREMQRSTLITGWWGLISFFANFDYIVTNLSARRALRHLPSPSPTPRARIAPLPYPMPSGRSPLLLPQPGLGENPR